MQQDETLHDGRIVRGEDPLNLEMPFSSLDQFITPTEAFYVRTHFPIPKIDKRDWRLRVEGNVEKPFELGYEDLLRMQSRTIAVTLECAGNNRNFLEPKVKGVQWGLGEVILEGADGGVLEEPKRPSGKVQFARSIPLAKARTDVLLAYQMNGTELPQQHGFPLRAIVPGWYAMASIKWLQRIIVTDRPFSGYYQTLDYAFWKRRGDIAELAPLTEMQIKAEIARPAEGEIVPANSYMRVHGAAWTSDGEITKVELSTDGGVNWNEVNLIDKPIPNAWRRWEHQWRTPSVAGKQTLIARATDSRGRTQPVEHDPDRGLRYFVELGRRFDVESLDVARFQNHPDRRDRGTFLSFRRRRRGNCSSV